MSHRFWLLLLVFPIASVCLFGQRAQLQITNASLPHGQQGSIYSEVFNATGGATPYRWKISAGTIPPGVTMNGNGNFVGPANIQESVTLSRDGKSYSGTFTIDQFDTNGNTLAHIVGKITAQRVTPD